MYNIYIIKLKKVNNQLYINHNKYVNQIKNILSYKS